MEFCCCASPKDIERIALIKKLGCTSYETNLSSLEDTDAREIESYADKLNELGMPLVSYNCIFPSRFKLMGDTEVHDEISEYLHNILTKVKPLGGKYLVLGSGRARDIPEGMPIDEAKSRFIALLRDCVAPIAAEYGMTILIEELRAEETNFINCCRDSLEIIRAVDHPHVKLLIDYYHAILGGDTCQDFINCGEALRHVHIASPRRARAYPNEEDFEDCREFFAALKKIGYNGAISLEGMPADPFDKTLATAMDIMTRAMNEA